TSNNFLYSVSCVSASDCTAVGFYFDGTRGATLVLQSVDPNPPAPTTTTTADPNPPAPSTTTTAVADLVVPVFTG
ncbi:MAG: hypothetical protein WEA11_01520, partial [Acidimicrobiales bacterium]